MKNYLFILFIFIMASCNSQKTSNKVFWVNSIKVETDAGVAVMPCLQIRNGDSLIDADWEVFYDAIEGFEMKTGYFQKIEVSETNVPEDSIPADGSSKRYKLVKVLDERADSKWRLNDIWAVSHINGKEITLVEGIERPMLEPHLMDMRIVGSDGCNTVMGRIETISDTKITFGALAGTLMMCADMKLSDAFNSALANTKSYSIKNLALTLYDANNKELVRFKKID